MTIQSVFFSVFFLNLNGPNRGSLDESGSSNGLNSRFKKVQLGQASPAEKYRYSRTPK